MDAVGSFFKELLLSFIPIFVAVDAIGILPIILGLAEAMDKREQSRMLRYAMLTALGLGLGFVALGKLILNVLGDIAVPLSSRWRAHPYASGLEEPAHW